MCVYILTIAVSSSILNYICVYVSLVFDSESILSAVSSYLMPFGFHLHEISLTTSSFILCILKGVSPVGSTELSLIFLSYYRDSIGKLIPLGSQ